MTLRITIFLLTFILLFSSFKLQKNGIHLFDYQLFANQINKDTLIVYNIYGVSTEGAEAKVLYSNKIIKKAIIKVYGETGQVKIIYSFYGKKIIVEETSYSYKEDFTKVKSSEDIILETRQKYTIDHNGKIIGTIEEKYLDIFKEFKTIVPFKLR